MVCTVDITEAVQKVVDCIINASNNTIPKFSPRLRKFRRPWWNEASGWKLVAGRRKNSGTFLGGIRQQKIMSLLSVPKPLLVAYAVVVRENQGEWINFISSITSSISSKQLWKKVKAANGIYREFSFPVITSLNTGNVTHSAPLDIADAFAEVSANDFIVWCSMVKSMALAPQNQTQTRQMILIAPGLGQLRIARNERLCVLLPAIHFHTILNLGHLSSKRLCL
ncbi:hypothetical protein AVEN_175419-1 [Araneus ventricosus]|uniref:Uncharacterized protein n=1 Tax=Araneus ventricosus TaxID=182803 RepID=A0A4Y2MUM2_ARAVE|nr:hypothetical protein AVEN_175419-1 [Araneus ventricosus]